MSTRRALGFAAGSGKLSGAASEQHRTQTALVMASALVQSFMALAMHHYAASVGPFWLAAWVNVAAAGLLWIWCAGMSRHTFGETGPLGAAVGADGLRKMWRVAALRGIGDADPRRPFVWLLACRGDILLYAAAVAGAGAPTAAALFEAWPVPMLLLFAMMSRRAGKTTTATPKAAMSLSVAGVVVAVAAQQPGGLLSWSGVWLAGVVAGVAGAVCAGASPPASFAVSDALCVGHAAARGKAATKAQRMWFAVAAVALSWAAAAPVNAALAALTRSAEFSVDLAAGTAAVGVVVVGHGLLLRYSHLVARHSHGAYVWCLVAPPLGMVWLWAAGADIRRPLALAVGLLVVIVSNTVLLSAHMKQAGGS